MRTIVERDAWTQVIEETEVDTILNVEVGSIRFQTNDEADLDAGLLLVTGRSILIPAGLAVYATAVSASAVVVTVEFGVEA